MLFLRSTLFNLSFYLLSAIMCVLATPLFLMPRPVIISLTRVWSRCTMWLLQTIAGTRYEIRGRENLPAGPMLVAAKHQSMWDTIIATMILDDPAIVMKRELLFIPYYGWYAKRARMISVDRKAGAKALRTMIHQAKEAIAEGRPILIYPEGTRAPPGTQLDYKPGVAALYTQLGVPCVPVAVNSGLFWPRRKFLRLPGTIVLEFLPPIPPGVARREFVAELQARIEPATRKLLQEAGFTGSQ